MLTSGDTDSDESDWRGAYIMRHAVFPLSWLVFLSGCTGTLEPVGVRSNYSAFSGNETLIEACKAPDLKLNDLVSPDLNEDDERLEWLNCEMLAKSMSNFKQAGQFRNRNEWRDIPLIGSALTAAALVLFGERGTGGNLKPGEIDVLEGIALGTAGFILLADYLNPREASDLLYTSAQGHRCLAEHGQTIAAYSSLLDSRKDRYDEVVAGRNILRGYVDTTGTDAEKQAAREELSRADKAISFYLQQRTARQLAPARLFGTAYDFGVELTKRARREAQSLGDIQKNIADNIRLQQQGAGIVAKEKPAPGGAGFARAPNIVRVTADLSSDTNALVEGLPNIALLVNGFTLCKTYALAGSPLPHPEVQFPGTNSGS